MKKFALIVLMLACAISLSAAPPPPPLNTPAAPVLNQVFNNPPTPVLPPPNLPPRPMPPIEIEQYTAINISEIKLRNAVDLEKPAMHYILAYEAYVEARKSKDPEVRAKLIEYMKEYRKAYAKFLSVLRQDNLYHPQKPKNPAGWYNKKHEKVHGQKRHWKKTDAGAIRKIIKEMVKKGASPEEIKAFINANLPTQALSSLPSTLCIPSGSSGQIPSNVPPSVAEKDDDDDDD